MSRYHQHRTNHYNRRRESSSSYSLMSSPSPSSPVSSRPHDYHGHSRDSSSVCDRSSKRQKTCSDDGDNGDHTSRCEVLLAGFESWWSEQHLTDFLSYAMEREGIMYYSGNPVVSCCIHKAEQTAQIKLRSPDETNQLLRLGSIDANGATLSIQRWLGSRKWKSSGSSSSLSSSSEGDYCKDYVTGNKILMWSTEAIQYSKSRLLKDLNKEMEEFGGDEAVLDAYVHRDRWVLEVANSHLAMKLRKILRFERNWWVYGLDDRADSNALHRSHSDHQQGDDGYRERHGHGSASADHDGSSSGRTQVQPHEQGTAQSSVKLYIRSKSYCPSNKNWMIKYINSKFRLHTDYVGDAIVEATSIGSCWEAVVVTEGVAEKLCSVMEQYPNWLISKEPITTSDTESDGDEPKGKDYYGPSPGQTQAQDDYYGPSSGQTQVQSREHEAAERSVKLYIRPKSSCPSNKSWLVGYINGQFRRHANFAGDALVDATEMDSCWAAFIANEHVAEILYSMLREYPGWMVSKEPIKTSDTGFGSCRSKETKSIKTPDDNNGSENRPGTGTNRQLQILVFQRPPTSNAVDQMVSFMNQYLENKGLCASGSKPVISAVKMGSDSLEIRWVLQAASEPVQEAIKKLGDVKFQSSTLSFDCSMKSSCTGQENDKDHTPEKDTNDIRGQHDKASHPRRVEGALNDCANPNTSARSDSTINSKAGATHDLHSSNDSSRSEHKETAYGSPSPTAAEDVLHEAMPAGSTAAAQNLSTIPTTARVLNEKKSAGKNLSHLNLQKSHVEADIADKDQKAEEDRLRKELSRVTSLLVKEKKRAKELEEKNEELAQKEREAQVMLQAQRETATSVARELEAAKQEVADFKEQLTVTSNQLHEVHKSWQEQYTRIDELKLQLKGQLAEIEKERALREDIERRCRSVTDSLSIQTDELARERQARRRLEQFLLKQR